VGRMHIAEIWILSVVGLAIVITVDSIN
jgi:hypothetical protein